jgi:hypothetical protein
MEISELNNYSAETLYALLLVSIFLNFHFFYLIILFFANNHRRRKQKSKQSRGTKRKVQSYVVTLKEAKKDKEMGAWGRMFLFL